MGEYARWVAMRWQRKAALKSVVRKAYQKVVRRIPRKFRPASATPAVVQGEAELWEDRARFIAPVVSRQEGARDFRLQKRNPRVVHLIGSLQPGGAERQLCNCVVGQRNLGVDVSVLLLSRVEGAHGHYEELLTRAGVKVQIAGERFDPAFKKAVRKSPGVEKLLSNIPEEFCPWAIDVFGELLVDTPDVFHAWLDHPNVWGGVGAILAKIPLVVLSTRNVNPTHFPYLASPYFHAMYRQFACSSAVKFINNSHAGADDYARWLNQPREKFAVVLNGVDFSGINRASEEAVRAFRDELGIPYGARVVAGVFRLSEEKQPLTFLEVVRRLIERHADVYAIVAGIGPYDDAMIDFIEKHQLGSRVFMLGRRTDVATIFSTAILKLLCSRQEGTPNVLLEAQWLGCPVVATKAGGAVDAVKDGETGYLVEVGDVNALTELANQLLENPALRNRLSMNGPEFIKTAFSVDRMVRETTDLYFLE